MTASQNEVLKALLGGSTLGSHLNSHTLRHADGRSAKVLPSTVLALVTGGYLRVNADNLAASYRLTRAGIAAAR